MKNKQNFVHCHTHSLISELDGLCTIKNLVKHSRTLGFPAIALTDHGRIGGLVKLAKYCKDKDLCLAPPIKPLLGCEYYISRNHLAKTKLAQPLGRSGNFHITVIAKNWEGYQNLCMLNDTAWRQGFYHSPRIDFLLLFKHRKGLIVTTGCGSSPISALLLRGKYELARTMVLTMKLAFQLNLFVLTMYHGLKMLLLLVPDQIRLSKLLDIPLIATNDSHYLRKLDAKTHLVLLAMSTRRCVKDPNRMRFSYPLFYLKTLALMAKIYGDIPQALTNTLALALMVNDKEINLNLFGGMKLPNFSIDNKYKLPGSLHGSEDKFDKMIQERLDLYKNSLRLLKLKKFLQSFYCLKQMAYLGLNKKGWNQSLPHIKTLLKLLYSVYVAWLNNKYDFSTYFLVVQDIINAAKNMNVYVAPGRGSCYCSVLLRCIGVCYGYDPLKSGIFERFLGFADMRFVKELDFIIS